MGGFSNELMSIFQTASFLWVIYSVCLDCFLDVLFQLGLVVDLTNTSRYYSPSEWIKQGIKHVKVRLNFLLYLIRRCL